MLFNISTVNVLCRFFSLDFLAVIIVAFGSKVGGNLAVEGGEGALHLFFEYFLVVLEKLLKDIVDEVPDTAWRPVS